MKETSYQIDTNKNQIHVEREFDAPLEQVWRAWTESELLEQWWAPKPFKAVTKSMNFTNGGAWHYYMLGPDGSQFWCMVKYNSIEIHKRFEADDYFCDEEGNRNEEMPGMHWDNVFTGRGNVTKVNVHITFASEKDLERIVAMGFKEGFAMAHSNLDEIIASGKLI